MYVITASNSEVHMIKSTKDKESKGNGMEDMGELGSNPGILLVHAMQTVM
jgi:hypothetical protein